MKAHKRSELTPKQRPKIKYFLKVGKIKLIKMFKLKSKMITAVILIIGVTAFVSCNKGDKSKTESTAEINENNAKREMTSPVICNSEGNPKFN